jgi:hypothetical protein
MLQMHGVSRTESSFPLSNGAHDSGATEDDSPRAPVQLEAVKRMEGAVVTLLREIGENVKREVS